MFWNPARNLFTPRGALALLFAVVAMAADVPVTQAKDPAASVTPKGTPLALSIRGKKSYVLDLNGATPAEYRKAIQAASKGRKAPPPPPALDVVVVLTNTGKEPITVWKSGDPVTLELTLTGPGSENINPLRPFTREFRIPQTADIAPGQSIEFPIEKLASGFRGMSKFSYWTDTGKYTLSASLQTGLNPKPEGAEDIDGFGKVTVTTDAFPIEVTPKK